MAFKLLARSEQSIDKARTVKSFQFVPPVTVKNMLAVIDIGDKRRTVIVENPSFSVTPNFVCHKLLSFFRGDAFPGKDVSGTRSEIDKPYAVSVLEFMAFAEALFMVSGAASSKRRISRTTSSALGTSTRK